MNLISATLAAATLFPLLCQAQVTPGTGGSLLSFEAPPATQPPSRLEIPIPDTTAITQKLAGTIARFRVSGLTAVPEQDVVAVLAPWTGRALTAAELTAVLNAVRSCLRQRGLYAADAFFPEQNIVDGTVEIIALEGRIGTIHIDMDNNARLKETAAQGYLSRLQPNSLIGRGSFDTPLLLLNDLPGVRITPSISNWLLYSSGTITITANDNLILICIRKCFNYPIPVADGFHPFAAVFQVM